MPRRRRHPRPLLRFVLAVVARPRLTLAVTLALVAASLLLSWRRLQLSTDENKLFSGDVPFFRDYLAFDRNFPESEATYVLLRARDGADERAIPVERWTWAADAIAAKLAGMTAVVRAVDAKAPVEQMGEQGVLFDDPANLRTAVDAVREFAPLARLVGEKPNLLTATLGPTPLDRLLNGLAVQPPDERTARFVTLIADALARTIEPNQWAVGSGQ